MKDLLAEQAQLSVYDPKVTREQMFMEFKYTLNITPESTPNLDNSIVTSPSAADAAKGAHAIAVMTEWDEFKTLDFKAIYDSMAKPAFIFDGRNVLPHGKLEEIGFEVYAIGKPHAKIF